MDMYTVIVLNRNDSTVRVTKIYGLFQNPPMRGRAFRGLLQELCLRSVCALQGNLAHKKPPPPLGLP